MIRIQLIVACISLDYEQTWELKYHNYPTVGFEYKTFRSWVLHAIHYTSDLLAEECLKV